VAQGDDGAVEASVEVAPEELDPLEKEAREDASRMSDHIHRFTGKSAMKEMSDKLRLCYVFVFVCF
jgi:hypothetical protein